MIYIKSEKEIQLITKSCKILAGVKEILKKAVRPGVSLKDLDSIAYNEIIKAGAKPSFLNYHGFKGTICASVNEELIHGIPSDRILKDGDLLSIDVGAIYEGYHSDSAFTISVGNSTKENDRLIQVAEKAFYKGLNAIKPNATTGDISFAIGQYIAKEGYFTPSEFCGHGIGKSLHEDPNVFNEGKKGTGPKLQDGMVICIEPMILQDSKKIRILKDGWTVVAQSNKKSSHYEQTVLIKNGKGIVLTEN
ncbi:MAG: type I methionyl aminopeptidase [Mycoplasma sp.]|nr:type I methionyl aminopeptidase [Mycoplasma sp.]